MPKLRAAWTGRRYRRTGEPFTPLPQEFFALQAAARAERGVDVWYRRGLGDSATLRGRQYGVVERGAVLFASDHLDELREWLRL